MKGVHNAEFLLDEHTGGNCGYTQEGFEGKKTLTRADRMGLINSARFCPKNTSRWRSPQYHTTNQVEKTSAVTVSGIVGLQILQYNMHAHTQREVVSRFSFREREREEREE